MAEQVGGDGFDPQGCASCGGTLLIKADREGRRAWLRCAGCELEMRLGPIFAPAVRKAIGDPLMEIDPLTPEPRP